MTKLSLNIISGVALGLFGALLVKYGNPANMGVCAACFIRDITGSLGFHRASVVQFIRPEIIGLILGGLLASLYTKEYKPVSSSSPFIRFSLGIFAMIGCLIFLGCPWRAFLRIGGGDMSALAGVVGLIVGIIGGRFFKSRGHMLEKEQSTNKAITFIPSFIAVLLFIGLVVQFKFGENAPLYFSTKGPGAQHANIFLSLGLAVLIGIAMQRSKFCSIGAFSKIFEKDFTMFIGVIAIIASATIANIIFSQYNFSFENQPIAHNQTIWNFLGMALAGLCFSLSEGCPGKHLVQVGSGNLNSTIFILGMATGAAIAHNFILASSGKGIAANAPYVLLIGFIFCIYVGFFNKKSAN